MHPFSCSSHGSYLNFKQIQSFAGNVPKYVKAKIVDVMEKYLR